MPQAVGLISLKKNLGFWVPTSFNLLSSTVQLVIVPNHAVEEDYHRGISCCEDLLIHILALVTINFSPCACPRNKEILLKHVMWEASMGKHCGHDQINGK